MGVRPGMAFGGCSYLRPPSQPFPATASAEGRQFNAPLPPPGGKGQYWTGVLVAHVGGYPERAADYGPFRELLEDGTRYSAQAYAQAHQVREELSGRLQGLFEHVDVVLCPTMPSTVPYMDAQGQARMHVVGACRMAGQHADRAVPPASALQSAERTTPQSA